MNKLLILIALALFLGLTPAGASDGILRKRVLVLNFDPHATGGRFHDHFHWNDPRQLMSNFIASLSQASHGQVQYQVTDWKDIEQFPVRTDGSQPSVQEMIEIIKRRGPDASADYHRIIHDYRLVERVNSGDIDEVWMIACPWAGFYESQMVGSGAYFCNSPGLPDVPSRRLFVMMGFNYERGVGEMLESYGHRAESILTHVYGRFEPSHSQGQLNSWEKFSLYDKIAPGRAAVGLMHFAPNSQADYDWGRHAPVRSTCDDWLSYPRLSGKTRVVDCPEWGSGDIRAHHMWWFSHLPYVAGRTDGKLNDWWNYIVDFNSYAESR